MGGESESRRRKESDNAHCSNVLHAKSALHELDDHFELSTLAVVSCVRDRNGACGGLRVGVHAAAVLRGRQRVGARRWRRHEWAMQKSTAATTENEMEGDKNASLHSSPIRQYLLAPSLVSRTSWHRFHQQNAVSTSSFQAFGLRPDWDNLLKCTIHHEAQSWLNPGLYSMGYGPTLSSELWLTRTCTQWHALSSPYPSLRLCSHTSHSQI